MTGPLVKNRSSENADPNGTTDRELAARLCHPEDAGGVFRFAVQAHPHENGPPVSREAARVPALRVAG
jgi:hypothetical protein